MICTIIRTRWMHTGKKWNIRVKTPITIIMTRTTMVNILIMSHILSSMEPMRTCIRTTLTMCTSITPRRIASPRSPAVSMTSTMWPIWISDRILSIMPTRTCCITSTISHRMTITYPRFTVIAMLILPSMPTSTPANTTRATITMTMATPL